MVNYIKTINDVDQDYDWKNMQKINCKEGNQARRLNFDLPLWQSR